MVDPITLDEFGPTPHELVLHNGTPDSIAGWKALADGLLTDQPCVFHRNLEISSRYAWMYKLLPAYFKWAGMAAFASYHVRLALLPFRLDSDRNGYVDIPHSIDRHRPPPGGLLADDVDTIRETNNAIFDDIFWVHLAYSSAADGIECLRALLGTEPHYAALLTGFEAIDEGRRVLEDETASATARRMAEDLIWEGNVQLLEHEQRAVGATQLRSPLVRVRQALLHGLGAELRGAWLAAGGFVLHVVLLLLTHTRDARKLCVRTRGRGSTASTTAGVGS